MGTPPTATATIWLNCPGGTHATPASNQTVVVALVPPLPVTTGERVVMSVNESGTFATVPGGVHSLVPDASVAPLCVSAFVPHAVPEELVGDGSWHQVWASPAVNSTSAVGEGDFWAGAAGVAVGSCGLDAGYTDPVSPSPSTTGYVVGGGGNGFRQASGTLRRGRSVHVEAPVEDIPPSAPVLRATLRAAFTGVWQAGDRVRMLVDGVPRLLVTPPKRTTPYECPPGYVNAYAAFCYRVDLDGGTFAHAEGSCLADGADLVSFGNPQELLAVIQMWNTSLAQSNTPLTSPPARELLVGLNDRDVENR